MLQGGAIAFHTGVSHFELWKVLQMQVLSFGKDCSGEADCKAWVSLGSAEWITSDLQNQMSEKWVGSVTRSPMHKIS